MLYMELSNILYIHIYVDNTTNTILHFNLIFVQNKIKYT